MRLFLTLPVDGRGCREHHLTSAAVLLDLLEALAQRPIDAVNLFVPTMSSPAKQATIEEVGGLLVAASFFGLIEFFQLPIENSRWSLWLELLAAPCHFNPKLPCFVLEILGFECHIHRSYNLPAFEFRGLG